MTLSSFFNGARKCFNDAATDVRYQQWIAGRITSDAVRAEFRDLAPKQEVSFSTELIDGQAALFEARVPPRLTRTLRATMSRVCAGAKEWGYLENNPGVGIRLPQRHSVQPKVTFQPEDLQIVLDHLEEPHRTLVLLIAVTGMRVSELLGLQWSDVDLPRRLLHIRRTFYRGNLGLPKTHSSERVIPISDGLSYALQQYRKHVRISAVNLVFPNADGNPTRQQLYFIGSCTSISQMRIAEDWLTGFSPVCCDYT